MSETTAPWGVSGLCQYDFIPPAGKNSKTKAHWNTLLQKVKVSVRDLARLLGRLTAAAVAALPAPLHYRNIKRL